MSRTKKTDERTLEDETPSLDRVLADPNAMQSAWISSAQERSAIERGGTVRVAVNGPETARQMFAYIPKIQSLREQIVEQMPHHPIALHDKLPQYVLGFLYAYQQWQLATSDTEQFEKLMAEGTELRRLMLDWAPTLVLWKVMQQAELDAITAGAGHTDTADDLVTLGRLNVDRWRQLDGKVGYDKAKAERAIVVGQSLLKLLGERGDVDSAEVRKAKDDWERAFTLLLKAYDEVRAAVSYVRRAEGDADLYAPSLYKTRKAGRRAARVEQPGTPNPEDQ